MTLFLNSCLPADDNAPITTPIVDTPPTEVPVEPAPDTTTTPTPTPTPTSTPTASPTPTPTPTGRPIALPACPSSSSAENVLPTPEDDLAGFLILEDETNLRNVNVRGSGLRISTGAGRSWTSSVQTRYQRLKTNSQTTLKYPFQWTLVNLSDECVISESASPNMRIFGASVSKIFVGATLLDKQDGHLSSSQLQLMADMIVVSDNNAWAALQKEAGNGSDTRGQQTVHQFTQGMGYLNTRGFRGTWNGMHGNELSVGDLGKFLADTYQNRYPGAETLWKLMYTGRTGDAKAKKYIPASWMLGGKTGTYAGPTIDPETGRSTNPDGSTYTVDVQHHVIVFKHQSNVYGLAILGNTGSEEDVAAMAGGIIRDHFLSSVSQ